MPRREGPVQKPQLSSPPKSRARATRTQTALKVSGSDTDLFLETITKYGAEGE